MMSYKQNPISSRLVIDQVSKAYIKNILVNDAISLDVSAGEIFGLLGPNGAGKTTLVKQIIGLIRPDSGRIEINGVDVVRDPNYARQACSFQAQTQVPISGLTARQAIELVGRIRGGQAKQVRVKTKELIECLEMGEWENKSGETFSGGVRRLVAFCMAAIVPGRIVILDEPTNDVDPLRRRLLWKQIRALSEDGCAVLLVTHNVLEAERAVDRLAIIDEGKLKRIGRIVEFREQNGHSIRIEALLEPRAKLKELPYYFYKPIVTGQRLIARLSEQEIPRATEWAYTMKSNNFIEEFFLGPSSLEDAYLRIIGREDTLGFA